MKSDFHFSILAGVSFSSGILSADSRQVSFLGLKRALLVSRGPVASSAIFRSA